MSERVDCVVVGAGVIGLAVGREVARSGRDVVVLDRHAGIGEETSSRNSEVIHAGLYYPTGSLKARLCVAGKEALYAYCEARSVPYRRCGKWVVATRDSQLKRLDALATQAEQNGVADIRPVDSMQLRRHEPEVHGVAALWSPSTGIVDSHALMLALAADIEAANGIIATQTNVTGIHVTRKTIRLAIRSDDEDAELTATTVINAAGLNAVALARSCTGITRSTLPVAYRAKGNYFLYNGPTPFCSLIYPLPVEGGLGIHATLDLSGRLRFGPDVEWVDDEDYTVDPTLQPSFAAAIKEYWPRLEPELLAPGYAGIRPKISGPGEPAADFCIDTATVDDQRQLVNLFGFESPGLTAALAIAATVRDVLTGISAS